MYISRIEINPAASGDRTIWRRLAEPYEFHRLLWDCFSDGPKRKRDFIYRQEGRRAFAISQRPPKSPGAGWRIDNNPYAPQLQSGQLLRFMLRANPVVSRRDANGRQSRHDLVMDSKAALKKQGTPRDQWPSQAEMVRQAGLKWMSARQDSGGYKLVEELFTAEGYRQIRFPKKGRRVNIAVMDLGGILAVDDVERFGAMLGAGLGPAKGFGCGLMLIRRV